MTQRRLYHRRAECHPDRPYEANGMCKSCYQAERRALAGERPAPRGRCPGCGRDDVVLLPPTTRAPWRRKAHAVRGDLQQPGTMRCRYPTTLNPDEIPTEDT